jgi:ankyrin repeat protein
MIHGSQFLDAAASTIRLLLRHGLNILAQDKYGDTSLSAALKDRSEDTYITKTMLEQYECLGIPIDPSVIFPAIESSSYNNSCIRIKELLKYGFEPELQNSDGNTALHHCAVKGAVAALRTLIAYPGVDIDIRNKERLTPLHLASKVGSI